MHQNHSKAAIHFISGFGIGGVGVDGQVPSNSGECFLVVIPHKRKAQIETTQSIVVMFLTAAEASGI